MASGRGIFITFEGVEGCGKSTQSKTLFDWMLKEGEDAVFTFEPGATTLGAEIRKLLLHTQETGVSELDALSEALLYAADRAQHLAEVVAPALASGKTVICDRYVHSSFAYQGHARGIGLETVMAINAAACQAAMPDLVVLLDISAEAALQRLSGKKDRMEQESLQFHQRVEEAYRIMSEREKDRFLVIPADKPRDEVSEAVIRGVSGFIRERMAAR